jgi:hypothetical protein
MAFKDVEKYAMWTQFRKKTSKKDALNSTTIQKLGKTRQDGTSRWAKLATRASRQTKQNV